MKAALDVLGAAWRSPRGRLGAIVLLAAGVAAVVGPWMLPDPRAQPDILAGSLPPALAHPFGTDQLSRDVLARVVAGARISLGVALLAVALSMTLGAAVGLVSATGAALSMRRSCESSMARSPFHGSLSSFWCWRCGSGCRSSR